MYRRDRQSFYSMLLLQTEATAVAFWAMRRNRPRDMRDPMTKKTILQRCDSMKWETKLVLGFVLAFAIFETCWMNSQSRAKDTRMSTSAGSVFQHRHTPNRQLRLYTDHVDARTQPAPNLVPITPTSPSELIEVVQAESDPDDSTNATLNASLAPLTSELSTEPTIEEQFTAIPSELYSNNAQPIEPLSIIANPEAMNFNLSAPDVAITAPAPTAGTDLPVIRVPGQIRPEMPIIQMGLEQDVEPVANVEPVDDFKDLNLEEYPVTQTDDSRSEASSNEPLITIAAGDELRSGELPIDTEIDESPVVDYAPIAKTKATKTHGERPILAPPGGHVIRNPFVK